MIPHNIKAVETLISTNVEAKFYFNVGLNFDSISLSSTFSWCDTRRIFYVSSSLLVAIRLT